MRAALSVAVLCAASFVGDVYLDDVTSQTPPQIKDATLPRPQMEPATEPSLVQGNGTAPRSSDIADRKITQEAGTLILGGKELGSGSAVETTEDEYYDDDAYEDDDDSDGGGDGPNQEEDFGDDEYYDDETNLNAEDDFQRSDPSDTGGGDDDEDAEDEEEEEAEELTRQVEVRSLSDLPLSKLLQVQTELWRLAGAVGTQDTERSESTCPTGQPAPQFEARSPSAQALNWGGSGGTRAQEGPASSTRPPKRRGGGGGWQYEEYEEEEEEEDGGWISWNKGKKKGKGDIGSVFQLAVTFLAFLAFGGYLLCLIIQAIKGGKGYSYPFYTPQTAQGQLRPSANVMMLMMSPTRLTGTRRPITLPVATGRRRRAASERETPGHSWWSGPGEWPSWTEEDQTGSRLWPHVDADRMHRALLLVAEGYAAYYHKKYVR